MKYNTLQGVVKQTNSLFSQKPSTQKLDSCSESYAAEANLFDDLKTHAKRVNTEVGEFIGL